MRNVVGRKESRSRVGFESSGKRGEKKRNPFLSG